jgi:hypothetical protein
MKNLIAVIILSSVWAMPGVVKAQINEEKMDKDLRVASKVLETLPQDGKQMIFYGGDRIEGNYIEGYGVIFSVNNNSVFYVGSGRTGGPTFVRSGSGYNNLSGNTVIVRTKPDPKNKNKQKDKIEGVNVEEIMVEFLANYSQMIGQLKPTDKIVVSSRNPDFTYSIAYGGESVAAAESRQKLNAGGGLSAELLKKDLNDYISGKISHDQLVAKIKVTKVDGEGARSMDLDMFSSMLNTIYDDSYTDTYFMSWKPNYERIKGVGAIYTFKVYSSREEDGLYRMPGIDKSGLSNEARNENVEKLYPLFVSSMKENVIQYGRTIKSLDTDELLILRVTLTKCDGCSIPKKIQFSVKQSVLSRFNTGKMSLKDAIAQVKMTKLK